MKTLKKTGLFTLACLVSVGAEASISAKFSLTPINEPSIGLSVGESRIVQYRLVNNGELLQALSLLPMAGVTQIVSGLGLCQNPVVLPAGKSCILSLNVHADAQIKSDEFAPLLCEPGTNRFDQQAIHSASCVSPDVDKRIRIHKIPQGVASLSVKIDLPKDNYISDKTNGKSSFCFGSFATCTLNLFVGGGNGLVTITNNSTTLTATNIKATIPASLTGVTQDFSACASLPPNSSCQLKFTGSISHTTATAVAIQGDNTTAGSASIAVFAVGDTYQNGFIVSVNPGNTGLLFALTDAVTVPGLKWAPVGSAASTTNLGTTQTNGFGSTVVVYNSATVGQAFPASTYAAGLCYKDTSFTTTCAGAGNHCWYLPSHTEIQTVKNAMTSTGNAFGTSAADVYWTSSENTATPTTNADWILFGLPASAPFFGNGSKTSTLLVHCLRAFG